MTQDQDPTPESATPPLDRSIDALKDALAHHGLELPDAAIEPVHRYALTLWDWNQRLNLTRHTTWDLFVGRDLRDTLQLSSHLRPDEEVLDVGSGGGVPGLLLALIRPDLDVTLSESIGKKAKVLAEMARELKAPVTVHAGRAESLLEDFRYHSVIARAVGPLWKFCKWFEPYWVSIDRMLLIKGPNWVAERGEARHRGMMAQLQLRCL
ncbi:MAG: class I SAM-dependent methyltransferase, partial [Planctomycetales bacterium]|nr:class I SAM-dependent methyltransferase [Planctomycetales bacterium]